jgi:MftR C-terminal domain
MKLSSMAAALADTLRARGVGDPAAGLAAEASIAVFRIAFERWIDDANDRDLPQLLREALAQLQAFTAVS